MNQIDHFCGNSKIFSIFWATCVVTDSFQKRFVINMQLRQYFQSQAFPTVRKTGQARFCLAFFDFQQNSICLVLSSFYIRWRIRVNVQHGETVDNRCTTYILFNKKPVARWTFSGHMSEIWPHFILVGLALQNSFSLFMKNKATLKKNIFSATRLENFLINVVWDRNIWLFENIASNISFEEIC